MKRSGVTDKLDGFRRQEEFVRSLEENLNPQADFEKVIRHEHAVSRSSNGRTVFDDRQRQLF